MKDENDRLCNQELPDDPFDGEILGADAPRLLTVQDLLQSSLSRATTRDKRSFGTSGHARLDEATGGLRSGDMWLIGADTSWGKSSLAVMIADENIKRGKRVLIVSAEDSENTYGDRLMRRRSGVAADRVRHQRLSAVDLDAMTAVVAKAEPLPVFLDARGKTVEWLAPRCKRAIVEHKIDTVIFDYAGAFVNKLKQQDRRGVVHYVARVLTDIVKTAIPGGINGVLLSQLTHGDDTTAPGKNSIRDSKDLLHMAEVGLIGFFATENEELAGIKIGHRCIHLVKVKEGPAGACVRMPWNPETASFESVHDDEWGSWDNEQA
jgi:replicative DNA helicase